MAEEVRLGPMTEEMGVDVEEVRESGVGWLADTLRSGRGEHIIGITSSQSSEFSPASSSGLAFPSSSPMTSCVLSNLPTSTCCSCEPLLAPLASLDWDLPFFKTLAVSFTLDRTAERGMATLSSREEPVATVGGEVSGLATYVLVTEKYLLTSSGGLEGREVPVERNRSLAATGLRRGMEVAGAREMILGTQVVVVVVVWVELVGTQSGVA